MSKKLSIAEAEVRKPDLCTAITNLKASPDFQVFLELAPQKAFARLEKKLLTEKDPVDLYRAQGGKYELLRFIDVDRLLQELTKELHEHSERKPDGETGS